jgi:6-phospho-3-hexuloisomerase
MNHILEYAGKINETLAKIICMADESAFQRLVNEIRQANRVFVYGKGRSGIVLRMFSMRLMHLGLTTYVVEETTTPSIGKNDLLLIASGSGKTASCQLAARLAKDAGAFVGLITATSESAIAQNSDFSVVLPVGKVIPQSAAKQFGGSYFEQALLICLDAVIAYLQGLSEIPFEFMQSRHCNLE